ncbi:VOC family protein [Nocardiopsis lambiniae]|uniref:VOC family protein n=1 Tax=Nocardiopsis lambiniae TaxID=3075539 RepID=A0ABU2MCQ1_9ACTN|nr:VOC family protein [Nocardiopsis sp. DSM 44743]MDT0329900.1 VOC family protein [Nocardiopsis sp. DSM 44743]
MANLDSMLLASTDPDRLHDWYAAVLEPHSDDDVDSYRVLRFGHFHLLIDRRDDIGPKATDATRMIINFDVEDARAVAARMDARGTEWLAPLEDRDGSLFATAIDPDGNHVQIIQLSEAHRAAMAASES